MADELFLLVDVGSSLLDGGISFWEIAAREWQRVQPF